MLAYILDQCPQLAEAYGNAANEQEPTYEDPWSIITVFDEYVPGDKFKGYNSRKSIVLGYNLIELGEEVLTKDNSWMIPVVLRSQLMQVFRGGWSRLLRDYFHVQLLLQLFVLLLIHVQLVLLVVQWIQLHVQLLLQLFVFHTQFLLVLMLAFLHFLQFVHHLLVVILLVQLLLQLQLLIFVVLEPKKDLLQLL